MKVKKLHVFVSGRVQGVGFRYYVYYSAQKFPISGFVRNLSDGRVEVYAEGKEDDLEQLLLSVENGPRFSDINSIDIERGEGVSKFEQFMIKSDSYI